MIGKRLQEERRARGLSQADLLQITGAARRTVIDWEKGVSSPTAVQLSALAAAGFDVLYILTGQRTAGAAPAPALTEGDRILLDNFHAAPPQVQAGIKTTLGAFTPALKRSTKRSSKGG